MAALNILRAKGVQLYLATGRPPYHLHYLKKDLPFEFDGMVMMNGQYCRDKDGCFYAHPAQKCAELIRRVGKAALGRLLFWKKQILRFPLWKRIPLT